MTAIDQRLTGMGDIAGILDRERIIAAAGFNRWLVPPAALCIHLCIGMAYGFWVFWLPLSRAVGLTASKSCPDMSLAQELFTTTCDWRIASMGWMFTLFFVVLGVSAAIWGGWLERAGPRKAGVVAAVCWCGGLVLGAIGVYIHQLWLMWLGAGVVGGIGLGLGYISPVSTLVKWFPDRRGMATGMAIMGFGGGAMIGAPLANLLLNHFKTPTDVGVWQTFLAMAAIYFVFMMIGAFRYRLPPAGWRPDGWTPPPETNTHDHPASGASERRAQDAAVLADLVGALPERLRRHRRHRHGLADAAGDLCRQADRASGACLQRARHLAEGGDRRHRGGLRRAIVAVQHRRPLLLGVAVRLYRAQENLLHVLHSRHRLLPADAVVGQCRLESGVRRAPSASSCRCTAAASPRCRPIWPTCSAPSSSAPFTAAC